MEVKVEEKKKRNETKRRKGKEIRKKKRKEKNKRKQKESGGVEIIKKTEKINRKLNGRVTSCAF